MAIEVTRNSGLTTPSYRPEGRLDVANALAPFRGSWGTRQAAHLLRRAGFGGTPAAVSAVAAGTMDAAVDGLIHYPSVSALPDTPELLDDLPADARFPGMPSDPDALKARQMALGRARRENAAAMQRWWLDRMVASPAPLQEKMTLFWHGHFTSAYEKGIPAFRLIAQNELFRRNALGNARGIALAVSRDPAMLRYLDNAVNVRAHPNENYAREFFELFTLGIGNYSETDVREAARAFTGWTIRPRFGWEFYDNPRTHDPGLKTIFGRSGPFDGSDVVRLAFEQPAAARWFAAKLLNFFVYNDPEPELIDALAAQIRQHDFELGPVMSQLLRSNVFYSARAYRALVKSPIEFVVGTYQLYGFTAVQPTVLAVLNRLAQRPFFPPNVKGWEGGASWLNSQAMLTRANFAASVAATAANAPWLHHSVEANDPSAIARTLALVTVQDDLSPASLARLERTLEGDDGQPEFSYENAAERIRAAAYLALVTPAYHLA